MAKPMPLNLPAAAPKLSSTILVEVVQAKEPAQKIRVERAKGALVGACTAETLRDNWATVVDFSKDTQHPTSMAEHPILTGAKL